MTTEEKQIDLDAAQARLANMNLGAETTRGPETLAQGGGIAAHTLTGTQFASVGTPISTQRPDDAFRAAQEGKQKRAPAVKGKCGHCGRYWSGHRYNNDRNVAYCYASENSTWFTPEEDMLPPVEQPAPGACGISEDEYDMIMRLDAERTKARQQAEEDAEVASASGRYFNEAEAEYFNYLGSLKKGGKP